MYVHVIDYFVFLPICSCGGDEGLGLRLSVFTGQV